METIRKQSEKHPNKENKKSKNPIPKKWKKTQKTSEKVDER